MPKAKSFSDEDEKTTIESDSQWGEEASTTVEQNEAVRAFAEAPRQQVITNVTSTSSSSLDESTVDDQRNPMLARAAARLVVTGGNDTGLEQAIDASKAYTIGRGLDNDLVLTDIAVSRKHFDLRNDGGAWVIVDRGSGNGTVVNGNLEDNPFMLANGDVIEIGTTTFRFDFRAPEPIQVPPPNAFEADDEEMSTVAGKPLNAKMLDSIDVQLETPRHAVPVRPKTLPPPSPLRPRAMTQPPAYSLPSQSIPMAPQLQPQGTPGPVPATTLAMPQMRQAVAAGPASPTLLAGEPSHLAASMPTTIPGQGMHPMYGAHAYPQATEIPPHSVHARMRVVQGQQKRGDLSTAHVQPVQYGMAQPQRFAAASPLSKRTKYIAVLATVAAIATIVTVAVLRGGDKKHAVAAQSSNALPASVPTLITTQPLPPNPAPPPEGSQVAKPEPVKPENSQTAKPENSQTAKPESSQAAKPEPIKTEPVKTVQHDPPRPQTASRPKVERDTRAQRKQEPPRQDPPRQEPRQDPPKRVAVAAPDPTERIEALYRDKKFTEAASIAASAARANPDPDESSALKLKAQRLKALAISFNSGMAPAAKSTEAFDLLVAATNYDHNLGGRFESEISQRLAAIAPKAAMSFAGAHDYQRAHAAVQKAESLGAGGDKNVKLVKDKLEGAAAALYKEAIGDSDPKSSKDKLRQVKLMVDSKSPWYQKATSKLLGN
ncbi:MAG: FHA domain-containing protein [Kofleriaceae bacterium]